MAPVYRAVAPPGDSSQGIVGARRPPQSRGMNLNDLTDRYVAVWSEPDADRRRAAIRELWADDAVHVLQAPLELREAAAGLGFDQLVLEARGHAELESRVTRAYQEFVAPGTFVFQAAGAAERLREVVKFRWVMVPRDGGDPVGAGLEFLVLGPDGRIVSDYQFIEG
ncbi:hypothetical protein Dsi01nite_034140 [Dactylosporangium siamense]|uniref:SnoaL-like domain-containing protein n=2 Tax=Dactylosporangium siamense TaxID=685454 RepID=A0A919UC73_9ACTN|nr:hypothetical protein Dsi01nite_034140 [Dactylosporangium siamense]